MPDPLKNGFMGFSLFAGERALKDQYRRRPKLGGSVRNIRPGHPLIVGAGNTLDRAAVTGGTNEVQTLTPGGSGATGSFTISWVSPDGNTYVTGSIGFASTAAQVQAALDAALPVWYDGCLVVAGGPLFTAGGAAGSAMTITYRYNAGSQNVNQVTIGGTLGGTATITPTTTTAGVQGNISAAANLLGFANEWEAGPTTTYPRSFAQAPINLDGPIHDTGFEIGYIALHPESFRFVAAIQPWLTVTTAMVGNTVDIGWIEDFQQCYVGTGLTAAPLVRVVGIPTGELGVRGGLVECVVPVASVALS